MLLIKPLCPGESNSTILRPLGVENVALADSTVFPFSLSS